MKVSPARVAEQFFISDDEPNRDPVALKTTTVRIPENILLLIDQFAEEGDISRNTFLVQLLQLGLQSVFMELPEPIARDFIPAMYEAELL